MREAIEVRAVIEPHQGTSYNPTVEAHQELLLQAHDAEERRVHKAEKHAQIKEKMETSSAFALEVNPGVASGMKLQEEMKDEDEEDVENPEEIPAKRQPARKTKAQRRKAAQSLAEVCSITNCFFVLRWNL